ncbi:hypothetical protein MPH_00209 [Macrophomina phaseolina MS6]|uniref:ML-like domain-containing protein n=1 Tax=Macrophomina phaseolina (strain MS6) TaxID=1126212 RepID=K2SJ75_MACPH|nr:hypothetical protein MPH_00209 [Macrophomina phaseolina MS6]
MANSSLSATLFNVVFTPNNRTLTFNIVGVSDISGNVTAELDLYAYGKRILQRNLDPCAQGDLRQLCPMNTGQINIESNLVLDQDVVNDIPGIAYAVPDLDARVQIYIKDANSGAARACVEADLLNGKTVYQHAVGWTTAVIVLLALIASAVASSLGHSNTAAHVASYTLSLFGYFQNQAYIGMTAVNLPPIVDSWTQNFQWSMGIIKLKSLQKLATWYQRSTGGTPSTIVSSVMNTSVQVEKKLIKRAIDLASRLSKRADEGSSSTGAQVTVVRGIERVGFRAGIETTNIFATAYIFFVLFSIVVIGCAVLFKLMVEVLEKTGRLQNNKLREFREKWRAVFKGIIIRIGLITFPLLAVVCCWELTSRDSAAEIVVAVMTLLASIVILGRSCVRVILKAKRSSREHKTPGYLLFSNPVFLTQWGALYLQFKTACYYFTLPLLVFVFVKALFVAFAQSSGTAQGFAFFILDLALLVTLAIMRPYMDTKTNVVNIFVAVINFISSILLLIFTEVFNQPVSASRLLLVARTNGPRALPPASAALCFSSSTLSRHLSSSSSCSLQPTSPSSPRTRTSDTNPSRTIAARS